MFRSLLCLTVISFSINSYAETCEGLNACADLYTKLTGEKLTIDKNISDEMTLAYNDANLTKENAKAEFTMFLNKNVVSMLDNGRVMAMRDKEFLSAPIYVVTEENMPRLFNKDALVTFVYHATRETKKVVKARARAFLSKKKLKSRNNIVEFSHTKIISVSDTGEAATKIMKEIFKADKL